MAITDYATLQTAVGNWLNRSDLSATIPDLITLGEKRLYRDLRLRCMEATLTATISSGVIALPVDYVELKYAYISSTPMFPLQRKSAEWIYQNYPLRSSDGIPKFVAREAGNLIFGPYPDSNYSVSGIYYQRLPALSNSNTTNWFITNAPDIYLFAALSEADVFLMNDSRIQLWEAKYSLIKNQLMQEENNETYSGSPLTVTASPT